MKKVLLIAGMLGFGGIAAVAAPLCADVVTTAADLTALGSGGCQFGDKVFFGFTYNYVLTDISGGTSDPVPASAVTVEFSNLGGLTNQPVISFLANWDVLNGGAGDISMLYSVSSSASAPMEASSLSLTGLVSNVDPENQFPSFISGAESIVGVVDFAGLELDPPLTPSGLISRNGTNSVTYAPTTLISITKDIFINSGSYSGTPGGPPIGNEATLTRIDQGITEAVPSGPAPEPLSFLLFGSGLITMVFVMKRVGKLNR